MQNKYGEINANLTLNIQVAPVIRERPIIKKVEKKKSVILQCTVQGQKDLDVKWFKEGKAIESSKLSRYSIDKRVSEQRQGEYVVQLEIADADVNDKGSYQLVAKNERGESQSQSVVLTEDQVTMATKEPEEEAAVTTTTSTEVKKKKKKVVKKKKKKEEVKEVPTPELSSFLKNLVRLPPS